MSANFLEGLTPEIQAELLTLLEERSDGFYIGAYKSEKFISRGGQGIILRSIHEGRSVAIKVMRPGKTERLRFEQEIRLGRKLYHPCVIPIFDDGHTTHGHPFYVMPFLPGESLKTFLSRKSGQLQPDAILSMIIDLATGLKEFHADGITHRDVSPANIWLFDDSGKAAIMDWGIAKDGMPPDGATQTFTVVGTMIGTPGYAPPEQLLSENVGPWSDLFSLGCVLYECLSGAPLFPVSSYDQYKDALDRFDPDRDSRLMGSTCDDVILAELYILLRSLLQRNWETRKERFQKGFSAHVHGELVALRGAVSVSLSHRSNSDRRSAHRRRAGARGLRESFKNQLWSDLQQIKKAVGVLDDSKGTTLELQTLAGQIRVLQRPRDVKDYETLFSGFNVGVFRAFNAPFLLEDDEAIRQVGLKLQCERTSGVNASRYLFFDDTAYRNAKVHFSAIGEALSQQQKAKVLLRRFNGLSDDERRVIDSFAYFVGERQAQVRCILYLLNPADRMPEVAMICDNNQGFARMLIEHFEYWFDRAQNHPDTDDWQFDKGSAV